MTGAPIDVTVRGPARAATRLFRYDRRLHVVVIVKTRLQFVPEGLMRAEVPPDVGVSDATDPVAAESLEAAEFVPYRPAADITFRGRCYVQGEIKAPPKTVARLVILRPESAEGTLEGAETLLNKSLCAFELENFGPRPFHERLEILPPLERARANAPTPELWSTMDFGFFHAAPSDQRTHFLRGDEWIWLEKLHPHFDRVASQLPLLQPLGALRLPFEMKRFPMRIDTLGLDGDRGCCDVVARGSFAISSEAELKRVRLVAGFDLHPSAVEEAAPRTQAIRALGPVPAPVVKPKREMTMLLEPTAPAPSERSNDRRTMILEDMPPIMATAPRRAPTVLLEMDPPPATVAVPEDAAPITVSPSALEDRHDDEPPATRAPFQVAKGRTPRRSSDIPGSPWAKQPPPAVPLLRFDDRETFALVDEQTSDDAPTLPPALPPPPEPKPEEKNPAPPKDPWRKLPEDLPAPPKPPPPPPPKVGVASEAMKKSHYQRLRRR